MWIKCFFFSFLLTYSILIKKSKKFIKSQKKSHFLANMAYSMTLGCFLRFWPPSPKTRIFLALDLNSPWKILYAYFLSRWNSPFFNFRPLIHGNRYMKIFVNKPLKNFKKLSEIIKSIKETENNHKNSFFNLGRNSMEIVHRPF